MTGFPAAPADVTPAWLSGVLDAPVTDVSTEALGEGVGVMAQVTRLRLSYADGVSGDADRPQTLIMKSVSPADQNRQTAVDYGFYRREVRFYQDVADRMSITVPRSYYADMDETSAPFVVLMEEISGARMVDQLEPGTLDDAEKVMEEIAVLHAHWWESSALDELEWLPPVNNDQYKSYVDVMPHLVPVLRAKYEDRVEPEGWSLLEAMGERYPAYLDGWVEDGPVTFIHYDLRPDNIFFDPPAAPDSVCLLDWQLAVRHRGTFDVSYYLGQSVPAEFRRANEEYLVQHYHDALTALGVSGYSQDRCWDDYRRGMLMHLVSATQIAVLDGGNERGQRLLDAMLTAGWTAAVELDSGELLPD